MTPTAADRAAGALAGLFIGDALAMPVHWYYDTRRLAAAAAVWDVLLPVLSGVPLKEVLEREMAAQRNAHFGHPFRKWVDRPDAAVVGQRLSTACYVEDAVPAVIYLAYKYADDPVQALVANTHLGGDNAHRGALMGALVGAACGVDAFPQPWRSGLKTPLPVF